MKLFNDGYDEYEQHQYDEAAKQNDRLIKKIKALWSAILKAVRS